MVVRAQTLTLSHHEFYYPGRGWLPIATLRPVPNAYKCIARCCARGTDSSCQERLRASTRTANKDRGARASRAVEEPGGARSVSTPAPTSAAPCTPDRRTVCAAASQDEPDRLRVASSQMPVHEDHQGTLCRPILLRCDQLAPRFSLTVSV